MVGTPAEAERLAEHSLELGTESCQPDALAFYASQIACVRWCQGRLAEVLPLAREIVEAKPEIPAFRSLLALCHVEAGKRDQAAAFLAADAADGFGIVPLDLGWPTAMVTYARDHRATMTFGGTAIFRRQAEAPGQLQDQRTRPQDPYGDLAVGRSQEEGRTAVGAFKFEDPVSTKNSDLLGRAQGEFKASR
jgi:hypothetical protein